MNKPLTILNYYESLSKNPVRSNYQRKKTIALLGKFYFWCLYISEVPHHILFNNQRHIMMHGEHIYLNLIEIHLKKKLKRQLEKKRAYPVLLLLFPTELCYTILDFI